LAFIVRPGPWCWPLDGLSDGNCPLIARAGKV
jgi:hypothetical protein